MIHPDALPLFLPIPNPDDRADFDVTDSIRIDYTESFFLPIES